MTRDAFADRLLDLAYGELSGREAREVEAHAASCEACGAELARLRETRRLMSALPLEAPAPEGERILLAAARQAAEARAPRRRLAPWLWGATAAAFSLVAVAAVSWRILAMRPGPLERPDAEALLGRGQYAEPPPPATPSGPAEPPRATAAPGAGPDAAGPAERAPAPAAAPRSRASEGAARAERAPTPRAPARRAQAEDARAEELAAAPADRSAAATDRAEEAAVAAPVAPGTDEAETAAAPSAAPPPPAPAPAPAAKRAAQAAAPQASRERAELAEGARSVQVRTFAECEGEARRRVEQDAQGRVVRYVREGRVGGRRVRVEHVYGPGGDLVGATVRDLDAGALLDPEALGLELPARAEEAGLDAPPRCGR